MNLLLRLRTNPFLTVSTVVPRRLSALACVLAACLLLAVPGCMAPKQRAPYAEIVPCPLNERANVVLGNVILECASSRGEWLRDMGPGCPRVWATQFGFAAGKRRQRSDLIELAEVTASRQNADLNRLILGALFGARESAGPEVYGVPALFISGVLNGSGGHYAKFRLALDRGLEELDPDTLPETHLTGSTVLLAELARTEAEERDELLEKARRFASKIDSPKFLAYALASIAKASARPVDLSQAREAVENAATEFRLEDGNLIFAAEETYVLSRYLALINALADMAQMTGNAFDRTRAQELLAFVFSEHLFNGNVIAHDGARGGYRSRSYCSGCNLNALYLVDRLYGDTFKIDPLPELPDRTASWSMLEEVVHELFPLRGDQQGTYSALEFGVKVSYSEVALSGSLPHGGLRLMIQLNDSIQDCKFLREADDGVIPLDADDRARHTLGKEAVEEGQYDPEVSEYTFEFGPSRKGLRSIRIVLRASTKASGT